ncbi:MAG TPA: tetratricopeptide repeat protein [Candidatus Dormibacteraeota bacterium]|nr:tetratricopeptide repeat protein [Candidatus Dormibacteraeota bacterium]
MSQTATETRYTRWILLLLGGITVLCYWPALRCGFVSFDDPTYLYENPRVQSGWSWSNIGWAFTTGYFCNWHPLTWLSYMTDHALYGFNAGGYHLTNLVFHIANTLLVFLLLIRLTQREWPSAAVAALFAWHPLHVESVVWISERKDVLSAFFFLLTLLAYTKYVTSGRVNFESGQEKELNSSSSPIAPSTSEIGRRKFYILALLLFACGLMSKAIVVTLPFVLLLLDFWPLKRGGSAAGFLRLTIEKTPFFLLSVGDSVVTWLTQQAGGALAAVGAVPVSGRVAAACVSYLRYLAKTVWPADLSAVYVFPSASWEIALAAGAFLLVISGAALLLRRSQPWLFVGWFWFVGMLVPVIGLVQVGAQSMADRYMYLPSIGLFISAVWIIDSLLQKTLSNRPEWSLKVSRAVAGLGVAALVFSIGGSFSQIRFWRDGETLFRHAVDLSPNNYLALNGLGNARHEAGKLEEAVECFSRVTELRPAFPQGQFNLGTVLLEKGKVQQAVPHFEAALAVNPRYAEAHFNLGTALISLNKLDGACAHFADACKFKPDVAEFHFALGTVWLNQARVQEAITELSEALKLNPQYAQAHKSLEIALAQRAAPSAH